MADSLLRLEAALSFPGGAALTTSAAVGMQLCAAAGLVSACAWMAHAMQLDAPTLHCLAAALVLFTGPARMALVSTLGLVRWAAELGGGIPWAGCGKALVGLQTSFASMYVYLHI